jgi:hypothetical protein
MYSQKVLAKFTAGSNCHTFDTKFENDDNQGDNNMIYIAGPCFEFNGGKPEPGNFDNNEIK